MDEIKNESPNSSEFVIIKLEAYTELIKQLTTAEIKLEQALVKVDELTKECDSLSTAKWWAEKQFEDYRKSIENPAEVAKNG